MFQDLESYLGGFAVDMADRVESGLRPLFDPETDALSAGTLSCIGHAMTPYPPQAACVEAAVRQLARGNAWIVGEMGVGKASVHGTPVLTPSGWRPIETIAPGDPVVNPDGSVTTVSAVFPQGRLSTYRVYFSDGTHTDCCRDHVWTVNTPLRKWRDQPTIDLTLGDIMDRGVKDAAGNRKWFIPLVSPADLDRGGDRPIDPYVLGLLLGDGHLGSSLSFSNPEAELADAVRAECEKWGGACRLPASGGIDYNISGGIREQLKSLALYDTRSSTKFVPDAYLWASAGDRLALLRGLFDTDGSPTGNAGHRDSGRASNVEFCTTSPRLSEAVRFIVHSLGGTVSVSERTPTYTYLGEKREGQLAYRLCVSLPPDIMPFSLGRHVAVYDGPTKYGPSRAIDRVEPLGEHECTCIKVSHPNQLYIVQDFIVTHNTPIGVWIVKSREHAIGRRMRVVLTAPNHLVRKWKAHFLSIIPDAEVMIVRSYTDLSALRAKTTRTTRQILNGDSVVTQHRAGWAPPTTTEVYILPRDRGKLSYAWRPAAIGTRRQHTVPDAQGNEHSLIIREYQCPACGATILDNEGDPAGTSHFVTKSGRLSRKRSCDGCGSPLWQAYNGQRGELPKEIPVPGIAPRRISPCSYLRKLGFKADLYIADEMHELRGEGSLQGQLFADLASLSRRCVLLTGTLVGGYADNLLHLLWRSSATRLIDDGLTHDAEGFEHFVMTYGCLQVQRRYKPSNDQQTVKDMMMGRGRATGTYKKSLPGISPVLFTNLLADQAIFIRLAEMHEHLPRFDERVHTVPLDEDVDLALMEMQRDFDEHRSSVQKCRAWAGARAAFLRFPDKPWVDSYVVTDTDENGYRTPAFTVPSLPAREQAKDRRVRRLCARNKLRGRKTWVFSELTGEDGTPSWDWLAWFAAHLEAHGLRTAILRTESAGGPKPEDREAWIERHSPSIDVMLSHPTLVQTGLDLFDFPSLIFAFPGDNTYRLRQASRRAWRLGQDKDCEVDYVVSRGTRSKSLQEASLSLMADKMAASLAIEGDFSSEGLAAMSSMDDTSNKLAAFINGELDTIDSAKNAFARYRERFEALMPQMGLTAPTIVHTAQDDDLPKAPVPVAPVVVPVPPAPAKLNGVSRPRPAKAELSMETKLAVAAELFGCKVTKGRGSTHRFGPDVWVQFGGDPHAFGEAHPDGVMLAVREGGSVGHRVSLDGRSYAVQIVPVMLVTMGLASVPKENP